MANDMDERIDRLLSEVEAIQELNDGTGHTNPVFIRWRKRAEAAAADKLGRDSDPLTELRALPFSWQPTIVNPDTQSPRRDDHRGEFQGDLDIAVGILQAARESTPLIRKEPPGGGPNINVVAHGGSATADARTTVQIDISADDLRQSIATATELTPQERGDAIAAIPDKGEDLTLEKVDKLLAVATKSSTLLQDVLGWILGNAHHINF